MKLVVVLFLMMFTSCSFSQNEWWRFGKNTETKNQEKEGERENDPHENVIKNDSLVAEQTEEVEEEESKWVTQRTYNPEKATTGNVNIIKNPTIDKLIKFKSATIPPNMGPLMDGYRIQIFFDQSRKAVDEARTKMLQINDESETYVEYKAPNYFLLLGNFRTQLEAEKVRSELTSEFPAALVIKDKIYLPKIEEEVED